MPSSSEQGITPAPLIRDIKYINDNQRRLIYQNESDKTNEKNKYAD
jgi:hypothetical protein